MGSALLATAGYFGAGRPVLTDEPSTLRLAPATARVLAAVLLAALLLWAWDWALRRRAGRR